MSTTQSSTATAAVAATTTAATTTTSAAATTTETTTEAKAVSTRMPAFYVTHGGGPSFFIDGSTSPMFRGMDANSPFCAWFKRFPDRLKTPTPKAILVVSAHWETSGEIRVTSQAQHNELYFDYGGFPDYTYQLKYNAPGNLALSKRVTELVKGAGFEAKEDKKRNFDHGVFIPLLLMYPEANIPVVECSIFNDLDPRKHIKLGEALAPLRDEGVLIVGSGSSTHWFPRGGADKKDIAALANWSETLNTLISGPGPARREGLAKWTQIPGADLAHGRRSMTGRADHLLPLMVIAGAAGDGAGDRIGNFVVSGMNLDSFRFQ